MKSKLLRWFRRTPKDRYYNVRFTGNPAYGPYRAKTTSEHRLKAGDIVTVQSSTNMSRQLAFIVDEAVSCSGHVLILDV